MAIDALISCILNYNLAITQFKVDVYKDVENIDNILYYQDDINNLELISTGNKIVFSRGEVSPNIRQDLFLSKDICITNAEDNNVNNTSNFYYISKINDEYKFSIENLLPNIVIIRQNLLDKMGLTFTESNFGSLINRCFVSKRSITSLATGNARITFQFPHGGISRGDSFFFFVDMSTGSTSTITSLATDNLQIDYLEGIAEYTGDITQLANLTLVGIYNIEKVNVFGKEYMEINSSNIHMYNKGFTTFKTLNTNLYNATIEQIEPYRYTMSFNTDVYVKSLSDNNFFMDGVLLPTYTLDDGVTKVSESLYIPANTVVLAEQINFMSTLDTTYNDILTNQQQILNSFVQEEDTTKGMYTQTVLTDLVNPENEFGFIVHPVNTATPYTIWLGLPSLRITTDNIFRITTDGQYRRVT